MPRVVEVDSLCSGALIEGVLGMGHQDDWLAALVRVAVHEVEE